MVNEHSLDCLRIVLIQPPKESRDKMALVVEYWGALSCLIDFSLEQNTHTHLPHNARITSQTTIVLFLLLAYIRAKIVTSIFLSHISLATMNW